ncbi:hypothetical protein DPU05_17065 [Salmonella enterica subsp. enterica serovar Teddington]|nr:hypothetical protein [Salmonella enterica subsp. enterica serovar Teddington]
MQPALFLVGTLADINFVHTILESIDIEVSASNLYVIHRVQYKHVDKEQNILNTERKVKLKGCIFSLPTDKDFDFLKELIVLSIEGGCEDSKRKIKFYYKAMLVEKFDDILRFRSGNATFSSFLKTCQGYNILIQDDTLVSKSVLKAADEINRIIQG